AGGLTYAVVRLCRRQARRTPPTSTSGRASSSKQMKSCNSPLCCHRERSEAISRFSGLSRFGDCFVAVRDPGTLELQDLAGGVEELLRVGQDRPLEDPAESDGREGRAHAPDGSVEPGEGVLLDL